MIAKIHYPVHGPVEESFLDAWTVLPVLAAVTNRIRLGAMVSPVGYRFLEQPGVGIPVSWRPVCRIFGSRAARRSIIRVQPHGNRRKIGVDDPRLNDRVADNITFRDMTESESLLIGQDFGVITDIKTGPNGKLFDVSLSQGAMYEIFRR
jgi:hypothetical protein